MINVERHRYFAECAKETLQENGFDIQDPTKMDISVVNKQVTDLILGEDCGGNHILLIYHKIFDTLWIDYITFFPFLSFFSINCIDIPEKANLMVVELFDEGLLGLGALPAIQYCKEELLTKNARIVPAGATIFAQV